MANRNGSNSIPFWGTYATAAVLPNVAAAPTQTPQLQAGDQAYVSGVSGFFVCTTATPGAAVWVQLVSSTGGSRYYDIVVGNAPAGDTLAICDYLDTGNGEQLQAALTAAGAAGPKKTVFGRRGTYDRGAAGSTGGPITVPASVTLIGDGTTPTVIKGASDPQAKAVKSAVALDVSGDVREIAVSIPNLASADASGLKGFVVVRSTGELHNVHVAMSAVLTTPARLVTIVAMIDCADGAFLQDCRVTSAPPATAAATPFAGIRASGGNSDIIEIFHCDVVGDAVLGMPGYGFDIVDAVHVRLIAPRAIDWVDAGIALRTVAADTSDVQITQVVSLLTGNPQAVEVGILLESTNNHPLSTVRVIGGTIDLNTTRATGTIGVHITGIGTTTQTNTIYDMLIQNADTAAVIDQSGGGTVAGNGILGTGAFNCSAGIDNIDDASFRTGGNY
jgi:hypothetical protein